MRELASRQLRLEEQIRGGDVALTQQLIALFEQHRHDVSQATQARQLEEARVRQHLTDLST